MLAWILTFEELVEVPVALNRAAREVLLDRHAAESTASLDPMLDDLDEACAWIIGALLEARLAQRRTMG